MAALLNSSMTVRRLTAFAIAVAVLYFLLRVPSGEYTGYLHSIASQGYGDGSNGWHLPFVGRKGVPKIKAVQDHARTPLLGTADGQATTLPALS